MARLIGITAALALGLLARAGATAPSPADRAVAAAEATVGKQPDDAAGYVGLAGAFMRKARESGDPGYYRRATAALDRAETLAPGDYDALRSRAWVLLGEHDFRGALAVAEHAGRARPDDWWNYGTLADARLELGDYDGAADAAQRMVDLRPGVPSYTRAAWLRALFGDRAGAIDIFRLAVAAGSAQDPEALAWTLVHLGHEQFASGDLDGAGTSYRRALDAFPGYYLALGGLARVRAAEGTLDDARVLYRDAVSRVPAPDLVAALGDVAAAAGDAEEAERQWSLVEAMGRLAEAKGTTFGRQLALFYADHDRRLSEALRLAEAESHTRGGIYTDDALAWALYKNGRVAEAARASHRALRLGTADALLDYHAGVIAAASNRPESARRHLRRALAANPYFDLRQAPLARAALDALDAAPRLALGMSR